MAGNTVRIRAVLDDNVSSGLSKIRDNFDRLGKSKGAMAVLQGVGISAGISAYGLLDSAISGVISVLGDATRAAMEDEASQSRLYTSIKSNIPAWDGNRKAIEGVLQARIKLGFSDEDQRDSLARIVVATHNVSQALAVQRGAMDLARLKGIDLGTASDALIKIEGGQFRALKALGIQLPKNATVTEALAAVERAAAGQAEAYAKTNEGKLLTSQVRLNEAMERLGYVTMPVVANSMVVAADTVDNLAAGFDALSTATDKQVQQLPPLAQGFVFAARSAAGLLTQVTGIGAATTDTADKMGTAAGDFREDGRNISLTFSKVGTAAGVMRNHIQTSARNSVTAFDKMVSDMASAADDLIHKAYDPIIEHEGLLADQVEIKSLAQIASKRKLTAEERTRLAELKVSEAEHLVALAKAGATTSKAFANGIKDLKTNIKNSSGPTQTYLNGVLTTIGNIERTGKDIPINFNITLDTTGSAGRKTKRARGGPVTEGQSYIVGENRPELFVPDTNGTILPFVPERGSTVPFAASGGGGTTQIVNFHSVWPPTKEQARDIARVLDEAQYSSVRDAAAFNGRV